ncbi:MAG: IS21-like element helper ATPase IstB [Bacteroidales bacterium]|jgi:DNA replication protein DnaC
MKALEEYRLGNHLENSMSMLKTLNMRHACLALDSIIESSIEDSYSRERFLEEILKEEIKGREKKKFERMLKLACFPEYKTLDEFNLEEQITLSKKQFNQLKELSWLEKGFNLILLGAPGVGKSHISVGIGIEALNNGYKVRFITMADLIHLLKTQEISSRSKNNIKRIISSDLVIIDDLMFMAMEKGTANMFFQLINKLYGQTSLIITSNKGPEDWGELIGDPAITTAILDRLIHKCEIINIHDNESYRMKHREKIFKE